MLRLLGTLRFVAGPGTEALIQLAYLHHREKGKNIRSATLGICSGANSYKSISRAGLLLYLCHREYFRRASAIEENSDKFCIVL